MKLYFVRHAQSIGNATGQYDLSFSGNLSEDGIKQAEALAERLGRFHFDRIVTSPVPRAMQTISPYLRRTRVKAELWPELSEMCEMRMEGAELAAEIRNGPVIELDEEQLSLFTFRPKDNIRRMRHLKETYEEGLRRVIRSKEILLEECRDESVLVVGHGHAGSRLLELLIGMDPDGRIDHQNTGISFLEQHEEKQYLQIKYLNHL